MMDGTCLESLHWNWSESDNCERKNAELYQTPPPDNVSGLTSFRIHAVRSNRNIHYCEQRLVDYRRSFDFTCR